MRTIITFLILFLTPLVASDFSLRENLMKANSGDYIVTAQNKNYTIFHIYDRKGDLISIEEITVPSKRFPKSGYTWRSWVAAKAPHHTCWLIYKVNLDSGRLVEQYSVPDQQWLDVAQGDGFLSTLLNLNMEKVPDNERKRVGRTKNKIWHPKLIQEGKIIEDVPFDAWRTTWPKDGSEIAGKQIEVYLPQDQDAYPSYFPYWLQIGNMLGKAKVRIIDSGHGLR